MKRLVSEFVRKLGGTTAYSGRFKIMHINDPNNQGCEIEQKVLDNFGYGLPFSLATNTETI